MLGFTLSALPGSGELREPVAHCAPMQACLLQQLPKRPSRAVAVVAALTCGKVYRAGTKTPDLATFAAVLQRLAHGARVPLRYFVFSDRHRSRSGLLTVDRAWCA